MFPSTPPAGCSAFGSATTSGGFSFSTGVSFSPSTPPPGSSFFGSGAATNSTGVTGFAPFSSSPAGGFSSFGCPSSTPSAGSSASGNTAGAGFPPFSSLFDFGCPPSPPGSSFGSTSAPIFGPAPPPIFGSPASGRKANRNAKGGSPSTRPSPPPVVSASSPLERNGNTTINKVEKQSEVLDEKLEDLDNKSPEHEIEKEDISLKVAVDKKKNRVVFAETDGDFVDVIFSFLTLPIGRILTLQGKSRDHTIGCMTNLYESVSHLDARLFRTEPCKEMLLHPKSSSEAHCMKLKTRYDMNLENPKCFYFCENLDCRRQGVAKLSSSPNAHCPCGQLLDQCATLSEQAGNISSDEEGGIFVKGGSSTFLISDDLHVMPGLSSLAIQLLRKLRISNANELEMQNVTLGPEKVLQLLGLIIVSATPLTNWIFPEQCSTAPARVEEESSSGRCVEHTDTNDGSILNNVEQDNCTPTFDDNSKSNDSPVTTKAKQQSSAETSYERSNEVEQESSTETIDEHLETDEPQKMKLVLFISKSHNKVVYAECEEDFVDFLFSFLTFPLGSALKILESNSHLGSFDNIYRSVRDLSISGHLKSEELTDMLLSPKLAPYFACDNQLLQIEQSCPPKYKLWAAGDASHVKWFVQPAADECKDSTFEGKVDLFSIISPRSPAGEGKQGGGYVKGPAKFMVTDDLTVTLLSPTECISFIGKSNVPITDVNEMSVEAGIEEAKSLLRAALISKTALTDVFTKRTHQ